jgi:hypothetical protein
VLDHAEEVATRLSESLPSRNSPGEALQLSDQRALFGDDDGDSETLVLKLKVPPPHVLLQVSPDSVLGVRLATVPKPQPNAVPPRGKALSNAVPTSSGQEPEIGWHNSFRKRLHSLDAAGLFAGHGEGQENDLVESLQLQKRLQSREWPLPRGRNLLI